MKPGLLLLLLSLCFTNLTLGQVDEKYTELVEKASKLYEAGSYEASASTYEAAFEQLGGKAYTNDRYNAACSHALAGSVDEAFYHLNYLAENPAIQYKNLWHISTDMDLDNLHEDARWEELLNTVRANKEASEEGLNKPLVRILDTVLQTDQRVRREYRQAIADYGHESPEVMAAAKTVLATDSINLIKVRKILDKHGWLGAETVGKPGSNALFLVIQHSDLESQLKYLPLMREAVKAGKAAGGALALLEDRVALRQGKKQVYGSQIGTDSETGERYVMPLIEPGKVNERRAAVGLGPIEAYIKKYGIKWDVEAHKKKAAEMSSIKH